MSLIIHGGTRISRHPHNFRKLSLWISKKYVQILRLEIWRTYIFWTSVILKCKTNKSFFGLTKVLRLKNLESTLIDNLLLLRFLIPFNNFAQEWIFHDLQEPIIFRRLQERDFCSVFLATITDTYMYFFCPLTIKEEVVLSPILLFISCSYLEIEVTCKKLGNNFKIERYFKISIF